MRAISKYACPPPYVPLRPNMARRLIQRSYFLLIFIIGILPSSIASMMMRRDDDCQQCARLEPQSRALCRRSDAQSVSGLFSRQRAALPPRNTIRSNAGVPRAAAARLIFLEITTSASRIIDADATTMLFLLDATRRYAECAANVFYRDR